MSDGNKNFAFVSDNGLVVGVGQGDATKGVENSPALALALLEDATDLTTWLRFLNNHPDVGTAADSIVQAHGGIRLEKEVVLHNTTVMPFLGPKSVPAEA
jgi:hypothetical protein